MFSKSKESDDTPAELESQFILRLPLEPAKILREALRNSENLKDRFSIKIDADQRHGEVRLDHWLLPSKLVDLPTIIESLKTIDNKSFYKTADICQMLLCKEEDDQTTDEESPQKKKKDPNKVDKKYLWPHGITPPTKNVRRRRFRKTLKKKYVEAPEIEKEVKRLLRIDNDAVSVKWEVINEDDDNKVNKGTVVIKKETVDPESQPKVAEDDIFGGAVSDSEDEDAHLNVMDVIDENSQNSADDSHLTDSNSVLNHSADQKLITEFTSEMFDASSSMIQDVDYYGQSSSNTLTFSEQNMTFSENNLNKETIEAKLQELTIELNDIKTRRIEQEMKIENIENLALRQRFQANVERLLQEQLEKEHDIYELQELMKQID
ncbi:transcription initiation factor TFIID subunit 7 [Anthonomus grandis grandis]|uniref:transcription initiation factor TFIID subunit 7 n=1 Tax=Anthonomus grandis grandis TaxID=2921223 RepID=UPI0021651332|nr:transcription initiation factor TFIID subunit 7 [Anthonomus grandis grandis]